MSKTMNNILKIQEQTGINLLEMQEQMDRLGCGWEQQNEDPDAESKAEKILGRSEKEFIESLDSVPF